MRGDSKLKEIASVFLKLGFIGFGGPAAHISMMRDEVVVKRKWLAEHEFLDLVGATNLIPGPNSTEMAIQIGKIRGGWKGLLMAGTCFILPAVFLTLILSWLYGRYGYLPEVEPFIYGIKPAIIAIVVAAVVPLAKTAIKTLSMAALAIAALLMAIMGVGEIYILFGCGALSLLAVLAKSNASNTRMVFPWLLTMISAEPAATVSTGKLFLLFLKIGAILYGSGYVLFAFLDTELVQTGLMSRQVLIDAIAVGQVTPGPVFSAVTFVGYQLGSWSGAIAATIGVFLPSFVFVAILSPLMKLIRNHDALRAFIDAVNVASVALIAWVCANMAKDSITDWRTVLIAVLSAILLLTVKKVNSAFIVVGAAVLGFLLNLV